METKSTELKKGRIYTIALIAVMAAVMCILGPLSLPIGVVPITLTNLVIYMTIVILGCKKATISTLVYLLIGTVGLPVFSGFSGGIGKLLGPTGGYLIGYVFLALIAGFFVDRFPGKLWIQGTGMVLGTAILYLFGTAWLAYQAGMSFQAALAAGVIPFILGDVIKIVIGLLLGTLIRKQLVKAHLI